MEANIDPEINAASDANAYLMKYGNLPKLNRSPYTKQANTNDNNNNNNQDEDDDDEDSRIDHLAVDTATLLLKVLAYQMPQEEKNDNKSDKDSYVYYDTNDKPETTKSSHHHHSHNQNRVINDNDSKSPDISALVEHAEAFNAATAAAAAAAAASSVRIPSSRSVPNYIETPLNFVMMDPSTKEGLSKRLGRPRRTLRSTETPQQSSLNNSNDSVISRFRFDSLPISGSKGKIKYKNGKLPSKSTRAKKRVIKHSNGLKLVMENPNNDGILHEKKDHIQQDDQGDQDTTSLQYSKLTGLKSPPTTIVVEDIASLKAKGRSTAKDDLEKFKPHKSRNSISVGDDSNDNVQILKNSSSSTKI